MTKLKKSIDNVNQIQTLNNSLSVETKVSAKKSPIIVKSFDALKEAINPQPKKFNLNLDGDCSKPDGCHSVRVGTFGLLRRNYTNATKRLVLFSPKTYISLSLLSMQKLATTDEVIRLLVDAEIEANKTGFSLITVPTC